MGIPGNQKIQSQDSSYGKKPRNVLALLKWSTGKLWVSQSSVQYSKRNQALAEKEKKKMGINAVLSSYEFILFPFPGVRNLAVKKINLNSRDTQGIEGQQWVFSKS